ncbi:MAG: glycosyltransferase family 4 protein [Desulfovibrionales bacterium]|nr:glycosyltransferase family 4 protein [Desulfovibrionales bacterium]
MLKKIRRKSLNLLASLYPRKFDLYFEPNFIPLDIKAKNIVTTVHDFSFQIHPNWHPLERIEYFKNNFWKNIGRSNMIVTVSNFIRNQAIQEFGFEADRIRVIPNGFDQELFRPIQLLTPWQHELSLAFQKASFSLSDPLSPARICSTFWMRTPILLLPCAGIIPWSWLDSRGGKIGKL